MILPLWNSYFQPALSREWESFNFSVSPFIPISWLRQRSCQPVTKKCLMPTGDIAVKQCLVLFRVSGSPSLSSREPNGGTGRRRPRKKKERKRRRPLWNCRGSLKHGSRLQADLFFHFSNTLPPSASFHSSPAYIPDSSSSASCDSS